MKPIFELLRIGRAQYGRAKTAFRRRRFVGVEQMEARTLLSAAPIRIGSIGDSITDEYQFYAPYRPAAQNWVEILSGLRGPQSGNQVSFGAFSTTTARGETRNNGFAQDWAHSGATAVGTDVAGAGTTFVNQYDGGYPAATDIGLLNQTTSNGHPNGLSNIDVATILIGGNDYEATVTSALEKIAFTTTLPTGDTIAKFITDELTTAFTQMVTDIKNGASDALTAITNQDANFPVVLITPPNLAYTPLVQNAVSILPQAVKDIVLNDLTKVATGIDDALYYLVYLESSDPNLKFLDVDTEVLDPILGSPTDLKNPVIGGKNGTVIDATGAGPSYTDLFVGDGFHPGTVGQALLAKAIVGKIDSIKVPVIENNPIAALSDTEILSYAQKSQPVTTVKLTASPRSVIKGAPITFTVQIPSFANIAHVPPEGLNFDAFPPTGTVTFIDLAQGNKVLGVATLTRQGSGGTYTGSSATFTTSTLSTGMHQIVALYNGDTVYPVGSTSTALVNVGKPKEAHVFAAVTLLQSQLGVTVGEAQLNRWNKQLAGGARPQRVALSVESYLYSHTKLPRRKAALLLERARQSSKFL